MAGPYTRAVQAATGSGARYASDAGPWQQHLNQGPAKRDLEALERLKRLMEARGDEGLAQSRASYETTGEKATAAGVEPPGGAPSFLERVGRVLDYPGAVARSGVRELLDAAGGGDASMQDFREQVDRRAQSAELFPALQSGEDAGLPEKIAKGVGGFATDVALDPLTYLTGGFSAMSKKAVTQTVKSQVARKAASALDDDALEGVAKGLMSRTTGATDNEVSRILAQVSDEGAARGVNSSRVGDAAAEAYVSGGHTGLRKFLEDELGEHGATIWKELPEDLKGGLKLGMFGKNRQFTEGGGKLAESIGAEGLLGAGHRGRLWLRSRKIVRAVADSFGGEYAEAWGTLAQDLVSRRSDDVARIASKSAGELAEAPGSAYARYDGLVRASRHADEAGAEVGRRGQDVLASSEERLAGAPEDIREAARTHRDYYFQNPRELREAAARGYAGLDEAETIGAQSATFQRQFIENEALPIAQAVGVDVGDLGPDYVPRVLTKEGRDELERLGKEPIGGGGYDIAKERKSFKAFDPETGEQYWMTPDEIQEYVGKEFFATDATAITAGYASSLRRKIMDQVIADDLTTRGLLLSERPVNAVTDHKMIKPAGNAPRQIQGKYAPDSVADAIEKHFTTMRGAPEGSMGKWLDDNLTPLMSIWKANKTIARGPGYHVRNLEGGMYNNWLVGVSLADHTASGKLVKARASALRKATSEMQEGKLTQTIGERADAILRDTLDEDLYDLHKAAETVGLVGRRRSRELPSTRAQEELSPQQLAAAAKGLQPAGGTSGPARLADAVMGAPHEDAGLAQRSIAGSVGRWVRAGGTMAEQSEQYLRLAAFRRGMKRYGDPHDAKRLADAVQFNYDDLSPLERRLRNNWVPFFVFTSRNVPLQFRSLFHAPRRVNRFLNASENAKLAFGDEDFDGVIPEWMQKRLGFATDWSFGGSPIVASPESPILDLNRVLGKPTEVGQEIAGMLGPGPKQAVEQVLGVDTFTGSPFPAGGVKAPLGMRWAPGIPKRVDDEGNVRVPAWMESLYTDMFPFTGELERYLGAFHPESSYYDRRVTNLHSFLGPFPGQSMTLTPSQESGELRRRQEQLQALLDWKVPQPKDQVIQFLLEKDIPGEAAQQVLAGMSDEQVGAIAEAIQQQEARKQIQRYLPG